MNENPQHVFQVLTKRSRRLAELQQELDWTPNIWAGVSVESLTVAKRVDDLRKVGARVRFLSCEPLLGPLAGLDLTDIQWVICGGESGPGARPMLKEWVEDLQLACQQMKIPFFFKQWGGFSKKKTGFHLNGMAYREMPIY
jgi:protein gp37